MNLAKELAKRPWYKSSSEAVRRELRRLSKRFPIHMRADLKWLDEVEGLDRIIEVECLIERPKERIYYVLLADDKVGGKKSRRRRWVCS